MKHIGLWAIAAVVGMVLVGGTIGYVWLPRIAFPDQDFFGAWCSAFGVPGNWAPASGPPLKISSDVELTHGVMGAAQPSDLGRGSSLAQRCALCHGPTGITIAGAPKLTGQYAIATFKQLRDFQSGTRANAIMRRNAQSLTDTEMRQLAIYYASLRRPPSAGPTGSAPAIVKWGAPMRNIPPCGSCHGDIDHTLAGPWLEGEPEAYLRSQLTAFASDERHNDIDAQMRVIARAMSPQEIEQAASYYAGAHQ
jgi:cytochrome c553